MPRRPHVLLLACSLALACGPDTRPAPNPGSAAPGAHFAAVPATGERVYYYDVTAGGQLATYDAQDSGVYLVELNGPLGDDARSTLAALDVSADPLNHFQDNTFVYRLKPAVRSRVEALAFVARIDIMQPTDKLADTRLAGKTGGVAVIVDFFDDVSPAKIETIGTLLRSWGATIKTLDQRAARLEIDATQLVRIAAMSDVRWIEPATAN